MDNPADTNPASLLQLLSESSALSFSAHSSSRPSPADIDDEHIEPEPQVGNMEYKLKLIDPSPARFQHLVTQMKWRLAEGSGEALYVIGVEDDGYLTGLPQDQLDTSLRTLEAMAAAAGAATTLLRTRTSLRGSGKVAEVLVRRVPDDQQFIEVRVAAVGGAGAGKSTLLGVLVDGELDNGHGRARINLFRHRHEVASGQTSSIGFVYYTEFLFQLLYQQRFHSND
jgi:GTPase